MPSFLSPRLPVLVVGAAAVMASTVCGQAAKEPKIEVLVEKYADTGKQMERREIYRDGDGKPVNHGKYVFWFPNGNKSYEVSYVNGERSGKQINYHFSGGKSSEQTFNKGKQEGKEPWWDENGFMYREYEFADDTPHGTWVFWYQPAEGKEKEPRKTEELHWKQGVKDGPWTWWYENGQKGIEGQYRDHKQHGAWKYWDKDGTLTETRQYNDGELVKPPAK